MENPGAAARWLILGGFAIWAWIALAVAIMWPTQGVERAGMWFIMYGVVPVLVGYALVIVGVIIGVRTLLLARGARILDRVLWVSGAGSALVLADFVATSAFRVRVIRGELGWEVARVITVGGGKRPCAGL